MKGGQFADATCERYIFVQSTTVFNSACENHYEIWTSLSYNMHIMCVCTCTYMYIHMCIQHECNKVS